MTIAEQVFDRTKSLPESLQAEVLHFVDFLRTRTEANEGSEEWAKFSSSQLLNAYCDADSIYDKDLP